MFRNSNAEKELAMTHREGQTERCLRPAAVREMAERVQRWVGQHEVCKSCQRLQAARMVDGLPLCGRCVAHRAERFIRVIEPMGRAPMLLRDDDPDPNGRQLRGYAIRFNERSVDLGGFVEIIRPSAGDRVAGADLRALWSHDSSEPLGRVRAGTLRAAKVTAGIYVEIDPPRGAARRVESVERRDVSGMSFGFMVEENGDEWTLEADGTVLREVFDMVVMEVSPVAFPAYPTTSIAAVGSSVRSELWREQQTAERLRLAQ